MYNIQLLNKIAKAGTDCLDSAKYHAASEVADPDGIMVRSAAMHDMTFGKNLKAIARAGAGVNNIPVDECAKQGIVVFNTPGANANAVKELVICALILASRDVIGGAEWVQGLSDGETDVAKQVEKGKSQFAGHEIVGKKLGVIGLGAIGAQVANAAKSLGMEVVGFDKFITVDAAWQLSRSVKKAASIDEVFATCDYITVHIPSTPETKGMFNQESIAKMKDGVRILNFSRGDLAVVADIKAGIESGKIARYVTDFPSADTIGVPGIIPIPHLGASTEESEEHCAVMAAHELMDFLENGNIKNSVNYPNCELPREGDARFCLFHRNIPNMLTQITSVLGEQNINIENLVNRSKKDYAYTIVEVIGQVPADTEEKLAAIDGMIRMRMIK